jgi:hypothetical protein
MPTRSLSNRKVTLFAGLASAVADPQLRFATDDELNAMLKIAPAVRWDGFDLGMQASDQVDDRSLDDDAAFTLRGFLQAGGALPLFYPKPSDTTSILRTTFDLFKTPGVDLVIGERVGFKDRRLAAAVGDNVTLYKMTTDSFKPDTEGDGGYAYVTNMLPAGLFSPWSVVADATPVAVTTAGGAISGAAGAMFLRTASAGGTDVTSRATWVSADPTIAIVRGGIVELIATGSTTITATLPGFTDSTTIAVTVS